MRAAALFSGGKDSTYSIYKAQECGHNIECLVTVFPNSTSSPLLHYPNIKITKLQATLMKIPQMYISANSDSKQTELSLIYDLLSKAKKDYNIEGLIHGGIQSNFQKNNFEKICNDLDLDIISPVWNESKQYEYMLKLLDSNFRFIITSVTSDGLDDSWLGVEITYKNLDNLKNLSQKFGFNLNFEGGEAETLVISCPLFELPIKIIKSKKYWDGYRGIIEIKDISTYNYAK